MVMLPKCPEKWKSAKKSEKWLKNGKKVQKKQFFIKK